MVSPCLALFKTFKSKSFDHSCRIAISDDLAAESLPRITSNYP
jgi:hypothetical protein